MGDKARCYLAGLLMKAPRKNMERMEEYVEEYEYQAQQQFLSDSPWDHRALMERVGCDVNPLLPAIVILEIREDFGERDVAERVSVWCCGLALSSKI